MKKYYIYALHSQSSRQLYIGHTDNLKRRIVQHNKGRVNSTKPYIPYSLIYFEESDTKDKAVKREKELKQTEGRRYLRQFIK